MDGEFENNDNQEINDLISRFEDIISSDSGVYFDIEELEDIIDYYDINRDIKLLEKAIEISLKIYPNHSYFRLKSALRYTYKGQNDKAIRIIKNILTTEPDNLLALESIAMIYGSDLQFEKAIEAYIEMLSRGGEEPELWLNIALEYENLEKYSMALAYLSKILKKYPDYDSALYEALFCFESMEDSVGSIKFFTDFLDQNPYSTAAWFNLGISHANNGSFKDAVEAYDYVLAIDSSYSSAAFNKGNAYMNLNEFVLAIQCFKETFEHEPEDSFTHVYIAKCYENLELWDDAIRHYFKAIELNNQQADAWAGIGLVYHQLEMPHKALGFLEEALNLDKSNHDYNMAMAGLLIDLEKYEEAKKILLFIIEDGNQEVDTWYFLIDIMIILEEFEPALEILNKAPESIKNHKKLIFKMADLLIQMKQPKEAQRYLDSINIQDINQFDHLLENPDSLDFFLNGYSES